MKRTMIAATAAVAFMCSGCILLFPADKPVWRDSLAVSCQLPPNADSTHACVTICSNEEDVTDTVATLLNAKHIESIKMPVGWSDIAGVDSTRRFTSVLFPAGFQSGPAITLMRPSPEHKEIVLICWQTQPQAEIIRIDLWKKAPAARYDHPAKEFVPAPNVTYTLTEGDDRRLDIVIHP